MGLHQGLHLLGVTDTSVSCRSLIHFSSRASSKHSVTGRRGLMEEDRYSSIDRKEKINKQRAQFLRNLNVNSTEPNCLA